MTILSRFSAWLRRATAKTHSLADVAEFRKFVMAAFRMQPGVDRVVADANDPAKFKITMGDWSSAGDVTNLFGYLNAYPDEDIEKAVDRFFNSLTEARSSALADDMVVAVIRTLEYVDGLFSTGLDVLHEPLGADLALVYMADRPDAMSTITAKDLPGKDLLDIRTLAMINMKMWLTKIVADEYLDVGVLYYVQGNPLLSTSLILFDEFWESIATRFPGDVLIAIPRKDQLFIFDDGNSAARARARQLIDATIQENFNLLSPVLYSRRDGDIMILPS